MAVHHTTRARGISDQFRELVEQDGCTISDMHIDQLTLLIESAIDTAVLEQMERISSDLSTYARKLSFDAEHYRNS